MRKLFGRDKQKRVIEEDPLLPPPQPYPLSGSRSSSFSSLPLPAKSVKSERESDSRWSRKKQPAAVGILRALDPHIEVAHPVSPDDRASQYEPSIKDDKKDWKLFGERKERERDGGRGRNRDRVGREEDGQAELTRMIGYLTATASEDWALVLEVCERASSSEANAKEAIKALKREFKYAEPPAQLSAARLWAIMLRNSSQVFIQQSSSRKFLEIVEDVLENPQTVPVVRERLLTVVAAAAHPSVSSRPIFPSTSSRRVPKQLLENDREGFRALWRKVKPPSKPDDGIPFDPDDAMFNPPVQRRTPSSVDSQVRRADDQPNPQSKYSNTSPNDLIIPLDEDIRRLFQECQVGRGNAALLAEAVTYTKPEEMKEKEIVIKASLIRSEFYARCRASQELIFAQIPWASSSAERSRNSRVASGELPDHQGSNVLDLSKDPSELTVEEQLLAALLISNEELVESLRMYDDWERVGVETDADRWNPSNGTKGQTRHEGIGFDQHSLENATDRSRSLSPAPYGHRSGTSPGNTPSMKLQPVSTHTGNTQNLAPPPPAPHGPRLPSPNQPRSRTPSPQRSIGDIPTRSGYLSGERKASSEAGDDSDGYDIVTPIGISAKALGKRRVIEEEDRLSDAGDSFFGHDQVRAGSSESLNLSPTDGQRRLWHPVVHYVYDAAAERTQQRIDSQMTEMVNQVHL
ncbi:hypothetical protein BJ322DRAFT_1007361 [Thelephora terrestris]|uniref:VHS domain-containing protein n=1 Tax=Thelephora terrestris TaxID=56493 RepID=A0A9P6HG92_9AGAM|nr:hypothetical protein BJ322DRAFT_1007361 [Thelephora terrestris]